METFLKQLIKNFLKSLGIKRISLIGALIRSYFYRTVDNVFYLLFNSKQVEFAFTDIKKILIVRIDRIGDMVLSTPAFRAVRQKYRNAEIHLLILEYTRDLVMNNPNINKLLIYKKDIITNDYDLAIALSPGFTENYIAYKSGAKIRIGYTFRGGKCFLNRYFKDDLMIRDKHEVESALELVSLAGCSTNNKELEISTNKDADKFTEAYFINNSLSEIDMVIAIHSGSRQAYLRWPKEYFAAVADMLTEKYNAKIIMIEGADENKLVNETIKIMKHKPITASGMQLSQIISLIKKCKLFIGNSTGTLHIAAALKIPVIGLFGPKHPQDSFIKWKPWSLNSRVLSSDPGCPDCQPTDCKNYLCLNLTTPENVLKAADELLYPLINKKAGNND